MKIRIAKRFKGVAESATLKLNALVQKLKSEGKKISNLTAGEPDSLPPDSVFAAVTKAMESGQTKYTPVAGIPRLRSMIAKKHSLPGMEVTSDEVIVSNGAKQALFNSLFALIDKGDRVLFPSPAWLSYPDMVRLVEGTPQPIATKFSNLFKLRPEELLKALNSKPGRARAFIINSPGNPTGSVYSREEYRELGKIFLTHKLARDCFVISDEIYEDIYFTKEKPVSFLAAVPELKGRVITVNGLSKSASMTGWRVGWSVAPKEISAAISTFQGQSTSNVNSLAQAAACAALELPPAHFEKMRATYAKRRAFILDLFNKQVKLKIMAPQGAFYFFVDVEGALRPKEDAFGFCERALQEAGVALVPGGPFGAKNFVRLSFSVQDEELREGCERLLRYLS